MNEIYSNDVFLATFQTPARYYYLIGGRWSAKTYEVLQQNIDDALSCPGLRITIARKVYDSLKNTIYEDMLDVMKSMGLQQGAHFKTTVSPLYIKFANGSDVIFKGADRPDKLKGIAGSHRLILEELNEFTSDDFETIDLSMRGKGYDLKTYMMHNPVPNIPGSQHWFQEMFDNGMLEPGKPIVYTRPGLGRVCALKSTYKDNAFCPQHIKERLEGYAITNPLKYKLWTLGEYAELEGVVFKNWDKVREVPENARFIGYGLDFGFSQDPAAVLKCWMRDREIWIKGMIYSTGLTNDLLAIQMKEKEIDKYDTIIADSAEPKSIQDLYNKGFKGISGVHKKTNYKADMARVLQGYTLHLVEGDTSLEREFGTLSWKKDKNGKDLPVLQDGDDHYTDAFIMLMHDTIGCDPVDDMAIELA